MQAESGSPRIPIDPKLYRVARKGDINLFENYLRDELVQQLQRPDVPIHVVNRGPQLRRVASDGMYSSHGRVLNRKINWLLGVTYRGDTALHIAAYFGHLQVARRICEENISLLLRGNNKLETPLHYAARAGKHEIATYFIEAAKELHIDDSSTISGIFQDRNEAAAAQVQQLQNVFQPEDTDVARKLLRWRNRDGETALNQAVHNNCSEVVDTLMRADLHLASIPDSNNVSPLYVAAMRNSPEVVAILIESLRDIVSPEAYAGPDGQTALHAAAFGQRDIIQNILNLKPELAKAKDDAGSTPLHYAASANNIDAVQSILRNDKTPAYIADSGGLFPVHVAVKSGHVEVVAELFELCPDSDELLDAQGRNFLHIAVEKGQASIVLWARKNKRLDTSINTKDDEGNTPMHLAVKARHLEIFALLLESKMLDLGILNKKGLTPLDFSKAQMRYSIYLWQSRDSIIHLTLMGARSRGCTRMKDHFLSEYKLEQDQNMEDEAQNFENMAKSTSTVSVLIASASFAGIFTVSGSYTAHLGLGNESSGLNLAFKAFILTIAYAFICSIAATGLCMLATMTFMDSMDRRRSFLGSLRLVQMAIRGLVMAFALRAYIILTPLSKWLAILVCLVSGTVPVLINAMPGANIIIWALVWSVGLKELWRRGGQGNSLFIQMTSYFVRNLYFGFVVVLIVMLCSLFDFSLHFLVLVSVIIVPLSLEFLKV